MSNSSIHRRWVIFFRRLNLGQTSSIRRVFNQTDKRRKEQAQKTKEPGKFNLAGAQNPLGGIVVGKGCIKIWGRLEYRGAWVGWKNH